MTDTQRRKIEIALLAGNLSIDEIASLSSAARQDVERIATIVTAIRVNAERDHFTERYEGFNDCRAVDHDEPCDCGKAEAEIALAVLG